MSDAAVATVSQVPARDESPAINEQRLRLAESMPAPLRVDLVIRRQQFKYEDYYVVKDPLSLTYFRLQTEEAYIVGLLDGRRKLRDIYAEYRAHYPNSDRSIEDLALFINHLGTSGLLSINARAFLDTARSHKPSSHWLVIWGKVVSSVLFFKIPLVDPSPWLGKLVHAVRFAWTKWFVTLSILFITGTLGLLAVNHEEFSRPGINFFSASNFFLIWVTVIVIKTFHEFGHAATCRRFGGEVHEMGVCLMCFTPCGYVDASDAWMMRHKRHKIYTTIAGVFVELNLAALAAHLWLNLPDGLARNLAFNAMLVASINTLLFNANPLMRFDGYYLVCDLLEVPNLRGKAISYCSYHLQRLMLGYRNRQQEATLGDDAQGKVFITYAVLAYVYMIFIIYGLTQIFARVMAPYGLHDLGLLLGFFVEGSFVALPFIKVFMDAFSPGAHIVKLGPTRRYVLRTLAVIAVGVVLLFTVPTHHNVTAQAVVGAAKTEAISPSVGGMIQEVYVKTGQRVKAGDPIARIENPSVDAELAQRQADWERARLRFSALQADSSWKSLELMPEVAKAMDQARTEVQRVQADYDRLILRASIDGVVWGRNLEQLIGQYADTSGVLLRIADPSTLRLLIAVPEEKAEVIEVGNPVKGRWRADGRAFETTVRDVPRQPASLREYTAGMLSVFGGAAPLTAQTHANQMPDYPIYLIEAHLAGVPEQLTVEGMRAQVTIEGRQTTYASRLGRWFMRLLGFKKTRV
ncbi:MAG: efflux RND transporter periplasmic adaptor subunit [Opitutaceae bacterium]|nr:efflux RND transporter periplasmic adaptor subunit [Opitutaceae bacterium]